MSRQAGARRHAGAGGPGDACGEFKPSIENRGAGWGLGYTRSEASLTSSVMAREHRPADVHARWQGEEWTEVGGGFSTPRFTVAWPAILAGSWGESSVGLLLLLPST